MTSGIYQIMNKFTGKMYVGSSVRLEKRWKEHVSSLVKGTHFNPMLQNAWNKYGQDAFEYKIVEECSKEKLLEREEFWVQTLGSHKEKNGYNICEFPTRRRLGYKASPETLAKMSKANGGKNHPLWGKKMTKSWISNMKKAVTGVPKPTAGKRKCYIIKDSIGNIVKVEGLRQFCRQHRLSPSMLLRVITGKQKEYKGWTI